MGEGGVSRWAVGRLVAPSGCAVRGVAGESRVMLGAVAPWEWRAEVYDVLLIVVNGDSVKGSRVVFSDRGDQSFEGWLGGSSSRGENESKADDENTMGKKKIHFFSFDAQWSVVYIYINFATS